MKYILEVIIASIVATSSAIMLYEDKADIYTVVISILLGASLFILLQYVNYGLLAILDIIYEKLKLRAIKPYTLNKTQAQYLLSSGKLLYLNIPSLDMSVVLQSHTKDGNKGFIFADLYAEPQKAYFCKDEKYIEHLMDIPNIYNDAKFYNADAVKIIKDMDYPNKK